MILMFGILLTFCMVLLIAGAQEQRLHEQQLARIPNRILVNGIRGKSSITRLCAGALRGGRLVVVAKTTGTAARFIYPDASEEPIYRKFSVANVVEQIGIVRRAAAFFPDVLVIECMAVDPELQEINQTKLVKSTIGVLCNVREDHLAEMGPTLDDVARSLSRSMPAGGVCVTAERNKIEILRQEATKRNCRLIEVDPRSVSDEEMSGFTWTTFKENVAIALAVAELLGVGRADALSGMWAAPPDPGVLSVQDRIANGRHIRVANMFAANDPESTLMNVRQLKARGAIRGRACMVINCRPDRMERNAQMGALVSRIKPERVILIGEPTRSAKVSIAPDWQSRVVDLGGRRSGQQLVARILAEVPQRATLLTVGNVHGQGEVLLDQLAQFPLAIPRRTMPAQPRRPNVQRRATAKGH